MFRNNMLSLLVVLMAAVPAGADVPIWQEVQAPTQAVNLASSLSPGASARQSPDLSTRRYKVDDGALRASLQRVTEIVGPGSLEVIRLPMPDGSLADFAIYESPIMEDELAQKYPEIRTFQVYGIDDPTAAGRLDITPAGFHAMLYTAQGRLFIDPDNTPQQPDHYLARSRDASPQAANSCRLDELDIPARAATDSAARMEARIPGKFLQYRIAVAATRQYVEQISDAASAMQRRDEALAEIMTAINRVNVIYQRDLGIFFKLVGRNDELIDVNGVAGFNNSSPIDLIDQNQLWIDTTLGNASYDIGHVFSTGGGGVAWLGSTCDDANKARGTSGINNPVGDPFYIDFVAHEIGHQFNAEHSFNGTTASCRDGRNPATAFEPGSGSTIMAYAGICDVENLQSNSDATFHANSISRINQFTTRGGSCYRKIAAAPDNPNEPVVRIPGNKTIPVNTAFVLDVLLASDGDGDTLSYQWDQVDAGCSTDASSFGTDAGDNALFRSYEPQTESERHFPALGTQLRGLYDDAEVLPCQNRELNFRVTVRDGRSGQDTADIKLSAINTAGGFRITNLNTPFTLVNPNTITVIWDVAGTDRAPFNCPDVDIELMTFSNASYASYSIHPLLPMPTANDGIEVLAITPEELSHPRARIRVKCSNNVFYDISDADITINGTGAGDFGDGDTVTFFNDNGTTGRSAPACRISADCNSGGSENPSSSGGGGGGALDYRWLLLLTGLLTLGHLRRQLS